MKKILSVLALGLMLLLPHPVQAQNAYQPQGNVNIGPGDCSGSVTVGGTAQNAFAALGTRKGFQILNIDTNEVLWISFTGTAAANGAGSFPLAPAGATTFTSPGSYYSNVGFNKALSVVAATNGHKFSCTVW